MLYRMKKKKLLNSGQIYRKDTDCSENDILVHAFFFVRLLVYEVWSSLMYVSMQKTWQISANLI